MGCLPLADLHHFCLTKVFPKNSFFQSHQTDQNQVSCILHLVSCINQIVHGFVVYYPNIQSALSTILTSSFY